MHFNESLIILIFVVPFILMVIAVVDLVKRDFNNSTDKIVWLLISVLIPVVGPLMYLLFGKKKSKRRNSLSSY